MCVDTIGKKTEGIKHAHCKIMGSVKYILSIKFYNIILFCNYKLSINEGKWVPIYENCRENDKEKCIREYLFESQHNPLFFHNWIRRKKINEV